MRAQGNRREEGQSLLRVLFCADDSLMLHHPAYSLIGKRAVAQQAFLDLIECKFISSKKTDMCHQLANLQIGWIDLNVLVFQVLDRISIWAQDEPGSYQNDKRRRQPQLDQFVMTNGLHEVGVPTEDALGYSR